MRTAFGALLLLVAVFLLAAANPSTALGQHSWRETESETVYVGKYSNCDYGYYLLLRDGLVGHGSKAPVSNHGIQINLINPNSTDPTPSSLARYVLVYSAYSGDGQSLQQIVQEQRRAQKAIHKGAVVSALKARKLAGLAAMEFRSTFRKSNTDLVEEDVVAYRATGDILYHLQLLTTAAASTEDSKTLMDVVAGFHLTELPVGKCSND